MIGCGFRTRHPEPFGECLENRDFLLATLARFTVRANVGALDVAQFTVDENVQPLAGRFTSTVVTNFH